ncbi:MAG: DUF899 domain-containing protein [Polyangiales bacterium]
MKHEIVSHEQWLRARKELLAKEKEFTRLRDQMTQQIRELPWEKIDREYTFQGAGGALSLEALFGTHDQLAVYHFMLGPDWADGCPSCSFLADSFDGTQAHLAARGVSFVAVSRAPLGEIDAYKKRMGWSFPWVSSHDSRFNYDFGVSFEVGDPSVERQRYNYADTENVGEEMPGASFFIKEGSDLYHTYSTYGRGLDILIGTYNWLDRAPKGRDESDLDFTMAWVRRHDEYESRP